MNTFWLKIAAIAVVIAVVIVLIGVFSSSERPQSLTKETVAEPANEPEARPKTFYEQVEKDKEEFSSPPKLPEQSAQKPAEEHVKQQVPERNQPIRSPAAKPSAEPAKLYFSPLSEIDKVEAERLLNVAVSGRSMGRLPQTGYMLMVQSCRQIISKWPDSWYAYNAKKMLIDMPERFRERYKISQQELDISEFNKQRPGTELYNSTIEEESP
ncbi:MAG: hypothetical protein PHQ35_07735 [Phycisphaerae bacterium]|nr:hypothetical protein [Phycisphaerae bacterium]MDD5380052.1 hypothetical protein [Phycisphaerae bacterium]